VTDGSTNVVGFWRKCTSFTYEALSAKTYTEAERGSGPLFGTKDEAIRYLRGCK
jgi:hypothetical protein